MMPKSAARAFGRQQRTQLTEEQVRQLSDSVMNRLDPVWFTYPRHHIFWPIPKKKEVDTLPLAHQLAEQAKVYLPKMGASGQLTHHPWKPGDTLIQNSWGIDEPMTEGLSTSEFWDQGIPTLVWVPLLAFDRTGYRVGYGKGFYDQFLQNAQNAFKVGLSLQGPLENELAHDPWDIRLDACVSPDRIWTF